MRCLGSQVDTSTRTDVIEDRSLFEKQRRLMKSELEQAVEREDYERAAKLRDAIADLQAGDPIYQLSSELQEAVAEERYDDAAALRDQLEELCPSPKMVSDTVTDGVRVRVQRASRSRMRVASEMERALVGARQGRGA